MKKTTKLTAAELEKKFDAGKEDILEHFEVESKRVLVDLPMWLIQALDKEATRRGIARQAVMKNVLVDFVDELNKGG